MKGPAVDLVIPVHDGLGLVEDLLESIARHTRLRWRALLVDDASSPPVSRALQARAAEDGRFEVLRLETNAGFVRAANAGFARATAPLICLLNSDTVVAPGWLEALVRCARSDRRILLVNPVSNQAVNLSVAMPPGHSLHMMADRLAREPARGPHDVVTGVGFCLLLKREVLDWFGGLDEAYGRGYCEESDYCMRVTTAGFRVVLAPDAFVWHKGSGTFTDRDRRYRMNRRLFDARWAGEYARQHAEFLRRDPLGPLRAALREGLIVAPPPAPGAPPLQAPGLVDRARLAGRLLRRGELRTLARKTWWTARRAARRLLPRPAAAAPTALRPGPGFLETMPRSPERLRIVFLLQELSQNGGVLEVCQIVNRLVLEGHDALIATVDARRSAEELGLLSEPLRYPDPDALVRRFPEADVVVATLWNTTGWLADLRHRGRAAEGVYFCQDFEPLFYAEGSAHHRSALASYDLVPHRISTTEWLAAVLRERGWSSHVIPLGVNRGVFHPRPGREPGREFVVTAAARPRELRRGFAGLIECCGLLHRIDPTIRFDLFGCVPEELPRDPGFPCRPVGMIASPDRVARHLASCDLLLDPSLYQAFGRPGLEAMAVGTPAVLPDAGGIRAYAAHEENCLLYTAGDPETMAAAVLELRRDAQLRRRLVRGGLETARRFDHREEGLRHLEFYKSLLAGRPEAPRPEPELATADAT